jgi:hypothetical protein
MSTDSINYLTRKKISLTGIYFEADPELHYLEIILFYERRTLKSLIAIDEYIL